MERLPICSRPDRSGRTTHDARHATPRTAHQARSVAPIASIPCWLRGGRKAGLGADGREGRIAGPRADQADRPGKSLGHGIHKAERPAEHGSATPGMSRAARRSPHRRNMEGPPSLVTVVICHSARMDGEGSDRRHGRAQWNGHRYPRGVVVRSGAEGPSGDVPFPASGCAGGSSARRQLNDECGASPAASVVTVGAP